jgi:hypothetical protein
VDAQGAARQELVLRVLGWGTVVYLLITGFALDQHAMFELKPPPGAARLHRAQTAHADALDTKSRALARTDPVQSADLAAQAAKIRFETDGARKDQSDSRFRAVALIAGVLAFALLYPALILAAYRRTGPTGTRDLVPPEGRPRLRHRREPHHHHRRSHHRLPVGIPVALAENRADGWASELGDAGVRGRGAGAPTGVTGDCAAPVPTLLAQSATDVLDEVVPLFDQAISARESKAERKMRNALAERGKAGEDRQALLDDAARSRAPIRFPRRARLYV